MPRDGSHIYHLPPGTEGIPDTTIESAKYNAFIADVEQDLNTPRPIIAGGTGADDAEEALFNMGAEMAVQVVTNYDSHVWHPGSFRSAAAATGAPNATSRFAGFCYLNEALALPPTNANVVIEARDLDDPDGQVGHRYIRYKKAGVWGPWSNEPPSNPLDLTKVAGGVAAIRAWLGNEIRWWMNLADGTAEAGAGDPNTGSNFTLQAHDDDGVAIGPPALSIKRKRNRVELAGDPAGATDAATKNYVDTAVASAGFPIGTYMLFLQAAAPTGWTKGTAWNNHALRVVTGAGGVAAGNQPFTTVFNYTATENFTITASQMGVAPVGVLTSRLDSTLTSAIAGTNPWGKNGSYISNDYYVTAANNNEGVRAGGQAHSHSIDMRVQYVDAIPCYKH